MSGDLFNRISPDELFLYFTGGLGLAGIYLLEPASPQAIWVTLGTAFVFGLLGAGKLYWDDDPQG